MSLSAYKKTIVEIVQDADIKNRTCHKELVSMLTTSTKRSPLVINKLSESAGHEIVDEVLRTLTQLVESAGFKSVDDFLVRDAVEIIKSEAQKLVTRYSKKAATPNYSTTATARQEAACITSLKELLVQLDDLGN